MVYMCSCNIKIFNLLDYKKYNILIVGSRNIGPAVAGPAGPVPTPLYRHCIPYKYSHMCPILICSYTAKLKEILVRNTPTQTCTCRARTYTRTSSNKMHVDSGLSLLTSFYPSTLDLFSLMLITWDKLNN